MAAEPLHTARGEGDNSKVVRNRSVVICMRLYDCYRVSSMVGLDEVWLELAWCSLRAVQRPLKDSASVSVTPSR